MDAEVYGKCSLQSFWLTARHSGKGILGSFCASAAVGLPLCSALGPGKLFGNLYVSSESKGPAFGVRARGPVERGALVPRVGRGKDPTPPSARCLRTGGPSASGRPGGVWGLPRLFSSLVAGRTEPGLEQVFGAGRGAGTLCPATTAAGPKKSPCRRRRGKRVFNIGGESAVRARTRAKKT